MKGIIFLIIFIILITNVSALKITEVELDPNDDCRDCTEWAEFYSEVEINLSDYWIENSKSSVINLSGMGKGYIKIDFGKRFLTNTGDVLTLKKDGEIIDKTPSLEDKKNNDMTWQLCDVWEFRASTRGEENNCSKKTDTNKESTTQTIEETTKSETSSSDEQSSSEKEITYETLAEKTPSSIKLETINLNPKVIKTENNNEEISKNYAFYGFVAFSVFLGVLFIIRKKRYKNEFR